MKYLISILFLADVAFFIYGYSLKAQEPILAEKYIGFSVVALFLLIMPLFIFWRSKGKSLKDYVITKERIDKMRDKNL